MVGNNRSIDFNRWGITYLVTDSRLQEEEREELLVYATIMYLAKEKSKSVKGDSYEGHIETEGEHQLVAPGFSGQKFSAILDTNHGKTKLEFLVTEHINPNLN